MVTIPLRSGKMGRLDKNRIAQLYTLLLIHQAEPCGDAAEGIEGRRGGGKENYS